MFKSHSDAGIIGPKFVYPDGRLQEAGALIDADANVVQLGKFGDPTDVEFNLARAVHYSSAACVMIKKDVFEEVLGFDLCWDPAYYEDCDLCLKVGLLGLKTYYCPETTIVHIESATSADHGRSLQLNNIVQINRDKFIQRWGTFLRGEDSGPTSLVQRGAFTTLADSKTRKRVAIYSPFNMLPGGGEAYLLSIAEAFLADNSVTLITSAPYSRLRLLTMARELGINIDTLRIVTFDQARTMPVFDLFIAMANEIVPPTPGLGHRNIYVCQFPFPHSDETFRQRQHYWKDYERVVVYSSFVSEHTSAAISKYSLSEKFVDIIPPPVKLINRSGVEKGNIILGVGRFFTGGHCKRHDVMIEVFRSLLESAPPGTELHLLGSLHPENQHRNYFLNLQNISQGLPVFFHPNASREAMEDLYRRAFIYWHAAGIGVDISVEPEKCEHFGITVIEAMSAGCIPVVMGCGGPAKLVDHGRTGFCFSSTDEMAELTKRVLAGRNEPWVTQMASAAEEEAYLFSTDKFANAWQQL
jgi:glycosyltransferase involved in cell wall biosynthesis